MKKSPLSGGDLLQCSVSRALCIYCSAGAQGAPSSNATKIWITRAGKCYLCHNNSNIPPRVLRNIMAIIEARSDEVIAKWMNFFGEVRYFC